MVGYIIRDGNGETVLERLERLYQKLWNEGWYVDANTVALALQQIEKDNGIEKEA